MLIRSLIRAFISLLHPRMLSLLLWPVMVALVLWAVLAGLFWSRAVAAADQLLRGTPVVELMFAITPLAGFAAHLGWILLALLFVPMVLITATVIIGIFSMPAIVDHVASRDYPGLVRQRGGGVAGSAWNALVSLFWFALVLVLTLPLWLIPPLWPVLPLLLLGYLNYRMFTYDAVADHASKHELDQLLRNDRSRLFLLGLVVALAGHIPLLGLFAPVFGGLVFVHYGLARLQAQREAPIEGVAHRVAEETKSARLGGR